MEDKNTNNSTEQEKMSIAEEMRARATGEFVEPQKVEAQVEETEEVAPEEPEQDTEQDSSGENEPQPDGDKPKVSNDNAQEESERKSKKPFEPPRHLSKEGREALKMIPNSKEKSALVKEIDKLTAQVDKKLQQAATASKQWDVVSQIFEPHRQTMAMQGLDEVASIRKLLAIHDYAVKSPVQYIQWFAQQAGIDLQKELQPAQGAKSQQAEEEYLTPAEKRALELAESANAKASQLESKFEKDYSTRLEQSVNEKINGFRNAKNQDGSLKYPHFDRLKDFMAPLVQSGKSLEDAYEEIYNRVLADIDTRQSEHQKIKAEVVRKAKVAGNPIKSTPPAAQGRPKMSISQELAMRAAGEI